jgi:hypothetical protein
MAVGSMMILAAWWDSYWHSERQNSQLGKWDNGRLCGPNRENEGTVRIVSIIAKTN